MHENYFDKNRKNPLAEIGTLIRVLMLLVIILLVCKHPDSLIPNNIIPSRESYLIKSKNTGSSNLKKFSLLFTAYRLLFPLTVMVIVNVMVEQRLVFAFEGLKPR